MSGRPFLVIDFDGTLLRSDSTLAAEDLGALEAAGRRGAVRVLATGRSLFSLRRTLAGRSLPLDYIVFSTGAGLARAADEEVLEARSLTPSQVGRAAEALTARGLCFMIHEPIPGNHRFAWSAAAEVPPDFPRRLALYEGHCRPLPGPAAGFGPAAQLLAILPPGRSADGLREDLGDLSVVNATSPLDHASTWVEVFAPGVSKGAAVARLAAGLDGDAAASLAVGNDYNDEDILAWAGTARVTANAPEGMRRRHPVVPGNDHGGVAAAVREWLA